MEELINNTSKRMEKSLSSLSSAFNKIRTGRANPALLDDIKVEYYGNPTPLNQAANISVEEGRSLVISPWDKSLIPEVEIGRAHVRTPVTEKSRMPSSA